MSLNMKDLTAEERAIVEEMVTRTGTHWGYTGVAIPFGHGSTEEFAGWLQEGEYAEAYSAALRRILARRALFAPAQPEPEPKKCPNCNGPVLTRGDHWRHVEDRWVWDCQKPEPKREERQADLTGKTLAKFPVGNCIVCGELVAPYNAHAEYEGGYTCQPAPSPAPETKRDETVAEAPISEDHEYPSTGYDIELRKRWAALLGMDPDGYVCGVPAFVDIYRRCQELWPAPSTAPVAEQCSGRVRRDDLCGETHRCEERAGQCPIHDKPAPVAGELAEEVACASYHLHRIGERAAAYALEAWARSQEKQHRFEIKTLEAKYDNERVLRERNARSQAQPVAVGMSEELEWVLSLANDAALKHDDFCRKNSAGNPAYSARVRAAIAAVRAQAASAQLGRDLPQVRGYFDSLANLPQYQNAEGREFIAEIRAELGAQKGVNR